MNSMSECRSIDDKVLMLLLISASSKKGWMGITKLQKLAFLMEYHLCESGKRAFDYAFYKYNLGPMSNEVYRDYEFLLNEELIIEDTKGIKPSETGECITKQFKDIIPKEINSTMQNVVNEYASMSTNSLVDLVHRMRVKLPNGRIASIEDIPKNCTVLPKPLTTICARAFRNEYCETFRILSDRPLVEAIRQTRKKGGKSKPYEPLASS